MKLEITLGLHRIYNGTDGKKPITAVFTGSTAHWPSKTFDSYSWYRVTLAIPSNLGRPKIAGWRLIPRQET
jgi:hypothetical protein